MCLSTPGLDINRIKSLINTYFPDLHTNPLNQSKHAQLYIRILGREALSSLESYRTWALKWLDQYTEYKE